MPSYTEVSISGYNAATAPSDDGTVTATNKIQWSIIKTKLSDPLKTALESIDDNLATAFSTITTNLATANTNLDVVQAAYDAAVAVLDAPATTAALFKQTAAPTGWTKGATHDNKALRLITGTVSTGGSTAFTSVLTSRTITTTNMPAHTHSWTAAEATITFSETSLWTGVSKDGANVDNSGGQSPVSNVTADEEALAGTGSVSGTTSSSGGADAMDFAVRYVDLIIATKDA